jgi:cellulose synthase/poly-beta-1,6-N-acetylglucosamine synthase-like glycosyltransferase
MASEEPELCARLREKGWKIWRLDAPMTEHDAAIFRFSQWWRRTTRTGYGYAQAWRATANLRRPVNQRKLRSAWFWVVGVPAIGVALVLATGRVIVFALVPVAYAVQIARIALRRRDHSMFGWRASAMTMLAKAPELIGAARALLSRRQSHMIEYKGPA